MKNKKRNQAGWSLVEVIGAIFIGTLIMVAAILVLNSRFSAVIDAKVSDEVFSSAEDGLSSLSASINSLSVGGSFDVTQDNQIGVTKCLPTTCDYVLFPDAQSSLKTSPANGVPYGDLIPEDSEIVFLRRWSISNENDEYNLKKITIAICKNEEDTNPALIQETVVAMNEE